MTKILRQCAPHTVASTTSLEPTHGRSELAEIGEPNQIDLKAVVLKINLFERPEIEVFDLSTNRSPIKPIPSLGYNDSLKVLEIPRTLFEKLGLKRLEYIAKFRPFLLDYMARMYRGL